MKEKTTIKYAEFPLKDGFLFTQTCGDIALHYALTMDSITYEKKNYKIVKKHHDLDNDSYIFMIEEIK